MPRAKSASATNSQDAKRQNFNITPEQDAEISWLKDAIDAPTTKDAILRAIRVMSVLAREARQGRSLYIGTFTGKLDRLIIPELEPAGYQPLRYLVERPHRWRRQLWVKGRRLLASTVWHDMIANEMSAVEAAENWDLPIEAIEEIVQYCETHQELLSMEADEERLLLQEGGIGLEPVQTAR
jgi:hypothetical protein